MIVFCAGLRSSASTLQWQIAKHIVEANNLGFGFVVNKHNKIDQYLHTNKIIVAKQHRLTHANYIKNSDALILMTVRDLRDVQCSLIQRWQKPFEYCFEKLKAYVGQQQEWMQFDNIYTQYYETEWTDKYLSDEVCSIAYQLDLLLDEYECDKISNIYSLENNKQRLPHNHITNAQISKYKTMLTQEQITILETEFNNWLENYGYL